MVDPSLPRVIFGEWWHCYDPSSPKCHVLSEWPLIKIDEIHRVEDQFGLFLDVNYFIGLSHGV